MKNLIILLAIVTSSLVHSQSYYEGTALVSFQDSTYASIVFGRNGHAPKTFIVKESSLIEGKYYDFYLEVPEKREEVRETADILFFQPASRQLVIDRRKFNDSIRIKFNWL